ncbi:MAG: hypothetical protein WCI04_05760 [archaeon]
MGFLGFGKKKSEVKSDSELILAGANNLDIIVPDHAKPKDVIVEKKPVVSKKNIFIIDSIYDIGTQVMLSGSVESGLLKKNLKVKIKGKLIPISDLKEGVSSVKELTVGNKGTIFLRGKNLNILRVGEGLEFK